MEGQLTLDQADQLEITDDEIDAMRIDPHLELWRLAWHATYRDPYRQRPITVTELMAQGRKVEL